MIAAGSSPRERTEENTARAPYPPSEIVTNIIWHTDTILPRGENKNPAFGSDQFRTTWGAEDLFTAWGDGGGFGGDNDRGRVSLGVARISGTPPAWSGKNIWGGVDSKSGQSKKSGQPTVEGKANGMLSIGGTLYMWSVKEKTFDRARILRSENGGLTWSVGPFILSRQSGLYTFSPIQFGRDYTGVPEHVGDYVFGVFRPYRRHRAQRTGPARAPLTALKTSSDSVNLARVPTKSIEDSKAYEFFAGMDDKGQPIWSADFTKQQPIFEDEPNGTLWGMMAAYNPHLKLYFLTVTNTDTGTDGIGSGLGVYVAKRPWGPWKTAYFTTQWMNKLGKFTVQFPTKWMNEDGAGWAVHSGWPEYDGYFHLRYTLELSDGQKTANPKGK